MIPIRLLLEPPKRPTRVIKDWPFKVLGSAIAACTQVSLEHYTRVIPANDTDSYRW